MKNGQSKKIFFIIPVVLIILDRITKLLAQMYLKDLDQPVQVIKGFFNLTYSTNRGALFGFMHTFSSPLRFIVLTVIPVLVIAIIIVILIKSRPEEKLICMGMSFILGGAVGNLIDRFAYGQVIDFLDFYISRYRWPTFNLADTCIVIGIALIFFEMIVKRR